MRIEDETSRIEISTVRYMRRRSSVMFLRGLIGKSGRGGCASMVRWTSSWLLRSVMIKSGNPFALLTVLGNAATLC